jgi:gamma-glutamyltranspeptidase/glutathione hydrolase
MSCKRTYPIASDRRGSRFASLLACVAWAWAQALQPASAQAPLPAPSASSRPAADAPTQPEGPSPRAGRGSAEAQRWMAVTAHPLATSAAQDIIERGGSAVDAAIAAQMMLTLVEPQSSGIGGGGFLLHYDPGTHQVVAFDGRETAPHSVREDIFMTAEGRPSSFHEAAVGGLAVGAPGLVAMLAQAHREHGRLAWPDLFEPAIRAAQQGFPVSERLHTLVAQDRFLARDPVARGYFFDAEGRPHPVGHRLTNPELAQTLQAIAAGGPQAFYFGPIAEALVRRVREHAVNPGSLSVEDLADYRPIRREALCVPWRTYRLCGMPPPSSGGVAVAQILTIFGSDPSARLSQTVNPEPQRGSIAGPMALNPSGVHRFLEASKLAFADRDYYLADPAFTQIPLSGLLDRRYLRLRAGLIDTQSMGAPARPGDPVRGLATIEARLAETLEQPATTHLSIVDPEGRAVALTSSIEDAFGARLMVRGFLLNNQLTDFSFLPARNGLAIANRVQPGKRPRSSMAPTIVLNNSSEDPHPGQETVPPPASSRMGIEPKTPYAHAASGTGSQLAMVLGSPGGASIIAYVARVLQMSLAEGVALQQAIDATHFGNRNGPSEVEAGMDRGDLVRALTDRGHTLRQAPMTSGLHGIHRTCRLAPGQPADCLLSSGIDPRREGRAAGR